MLWRYTRKYLVFIPQRAIQKCIKILLVNLPIYYAPEVEERINFSSAWIIEQSSQQACLGDF